MFLSSPQIRAALEAREIVCEPAVSDSDIRPFGLRVHLADYFLKPVPSLVRLDGSEGDPEYETLGFDTLGEMQIRPQEFMLGATVERFQLNGHLAGFLDGRSTLARLGLFIHVSSQVIDGNTLGPRSITLELFNAGPNTLILHPELAVGMLSFFRSEAPSDLALVHSQYTGQLRPVGPRLGTDFSPEIALDGELTHDADLQRSGGQRERTPGD